ncbi:MAG: hypothetical protein ACOC9W_03230, partial [Persicimonas sp.]
MSPQDRIEQLAEHIVTGENPGDALDDLGEAVDDTLLAALVALTPADRARRRFVEAVDLAGAPAMAHIAWVRTPGDEIDAEIDRLLDGDEAATVCEALARAGVAWEHPALIDLLDDDRARRAAALTATVARPDLVAQWLAECQVAEDALEVLRAAALNGAELEESFSVWGDALASLEGADRLAARLDGLLAVLHPDAFARHALAGEANTAWLADRDVVADFLQVYGPTEWVEVLGLLEAADDEAFELAAYLATSAAAGIGYEEPSDDEIDRLGELLSLPHDADVERWQPIASSLGFGFAIAAAPDDQLGLLGAQVAAHERLSAFEIASAGIPGLPLSATHEEGLDLDATDALLDAAIDLDELHEASVVALVRTMSDLRALVGYD